MDWSYKYSDGFRQTSVKKEELLSVVGLS